MVILSSNKISSQVFLLFCTISLAICVLHGNIRKMLTVISVHQLGPKHLLIMYSHTVSWKALLLLVDLSYCLSFTIYCWSFNWKNNSSLPTYAFSYRRLVQQEETKTHLQFINHFLQVICLHLSGHDLHHLLPDLADLLVLCI